MLPTFQLLASLVWTRVIWLHLPVAACAPQSQLQLEYASGAAQVFLDQPATSTHSMPETVALARGEAESFQVVMRSMAAGLSNLSWTVDAGSNDVISEAFLVGYARPINMPREAPNKTGDWYPVPLLPTTHLATLAAGCSAPLWVDVRAAASATPGLQPERLTVSVSATQISDGAPVHVTLSVQLRVFNFTVPTRQSLPNVWGNNEAIFRHRGNNTPTWRAGPQYGATGLTEALRLMSESRISINDIYSVQTSGSLVGNPPPFDRDDGPKPVLGWPSFSNVSALAAMREASGTSFWNLGHLEPKTNSTAHLSFDSFAKDWLRMVGKAHKIASAAGFADQQLSLYMFDETNDLSLLSHAAKMAKAAFPNVAVMTTARDLSFGLNTSVDISVPHMDVYANNLPAIKKAREAGKQVWWYVSCCGMSPAAYKLDFFVEYPAIRSRLLAGAAPWHYDVDGFLYYKVAGWSCDVLRDKPLSSVAHCYNGSFIRADGGPRTSWRPYGAGGFPDGDGEIMSPGATGPMATVQMKNWRDGSEDYEYLHLLETTIAATRARGGRVPAAAELALKVPAGVLTSLTEFSDEPQQLQAWRLAVAEAIESLLS